MNEYEDYEEEVEGRNFVVTRKDREQAVREIISVLSKLVEHEYLCELILNKDSEKSKKYKVEKN